MSIQDMIRIWDALIFSAATRSRELLRLATSTRDWEYELRTLNTSHCLSYHALTPCGCIKPPIDFELPTLSTKPANYPCGRDAHVNRVAKQHRTKHGSHCGVCASIKHLDGRRVDVCDHSVIWIGANINDFERFLFGDVSGRVKFSNASVQVDHGPVNTVHPYKRSEVLTVYSTITEVTQPVLETILRRRAGALVSYTRVMVGSGAHLGLVLFLADVHRVASLSLAYTITSSLLRRFPHWGHPDTVVAILREYTDITRSVFPNVVKTMTGHSITAISRERKRMLTRSENQGHFLRQVMYGRMYIISMTRYIEEILRAHKSSVRGKIIVKEFDRFALTDKQTLRFVKEHVERNLCAMRHGTVFPTIYVPIGGASALEYATCRMVTRESHAYQCRAWQAHRSVLECVRTMYKRYLHKLRISGSTYVGNRMDHWTIAQLDYAIAKRGSVDMQTFHRLRFPYNSSELGGNHISWTDIDCFCTLNGARRCTSVNCSRLLGLPIRAKSETEFNAYSYAWQCLVDDWFFYHIENANVIQVHDIVFDRAAMHHGSLPRPHSHRVSPSFERGDQPLDLTRETWMALRLNANNGEELFTGFTPAVRFTDVSATDRQYYERQIWNLKKIAKAMQATSY